MTPADKRIFELLDRWLTSLDLHLQYAKLDDAAYWQVQPWPKHDRPNRWILEVARQKVLELKALCQTQAASGDGKSAEALEMMAFLANLVGSQHVQRFIPVADPEKENKAAAQGDDTAEQPRANITAAPNAGPAENEHTREMPRPTLNPKKQAAAHTPKSRQGPAAALAHGKAAGIAKGGMAAVTAKTQQIIISDAVRLLRWGRQWHELAELIARMAERPSATEIRRILRARKLEIEALAAE